MTKKSILMVLIVMFMVSLLGTVSSAKYMGKITTIIDDNFNTLNTTTWVSGDYSYYQINHSNNNSYLTHAPDKMAYGYSYPQSLSLKHMSMVSSKIILVKSDMKIIPLSTTTMSNAYYFYMYVRVNDIHYFDVFFYRNVLMLYRDWYRLYTYSVVSAPVNISYYLKISPTSFSVSLLNKDTGETLYSNEYSLQETIDYFSIEYRWWYRSSNPPNMANPLNKYDIMVDNVKAYSYNIYESGQNGNEKNSANKTFFGESGITFINSNTELLLPIIFISLFLIYVFSDDNGIRSFIGVSVIFISVLWLMGIVYRINMLGLFGVLLLSFGFSFIGTAIWYIAKKEENTLTRWGLELGMLLIGIFIIYAGVILYGW